MSKVHDERLELARRAGRAAAGLGELVEALQSAPTSKPAEVRAILSRARKLRSELITMKEHLLTDPLFQGAE